MRLERETAGSFVMWRGAAGMVCTVHDALIPLFNLSARTLVSLISKFLWKCHPCVGALGALPKL